MKGMKGKLMKKLKTVKQISYLNPDRILHQVGSFDGFVDNFHLNKSTFVDNFPFKSNTKSHFPPQSKPKPEKTTEAIDVEVLMKEIEEDEEQLDKENVRPSVSKPPVERNSRFCLKNEEHPICEIVNSSSCDSELMNEERHLGNEVEKNSSSCVNELNNSSDYELKDASFRKPDMDSSSLFDPKLLAAFEAAVTEHKRNREEEEAQFENSTNSKKHKYPFFQPEDESDPLTESEDQPNPLQEFDSRCPPGGENSVILYTTTLRGIRKTFEDCQSIRFLLDSFGLVYYERDVSIHSRYRDELWEVMGEKCLPPRLFVRGRCIGGAEQVLRLNEEGRLKGLFRDIPIDFSEGPCKVCSGLRFMLCYTCNGSRKVFEEVGGDDDDDEEEDDGGGGVWSQCLQCNENGLVVCPLC